MVFPTKNFFLVSGLKGGKKKNGEGGGGGGGGGVLVAVTAHTVDR